VLLDVKAKWKRNRCNTVRHILFQYIGVTIKCSATAPLRCIMKICSRSVDCSAKQGRISKSISCIICSSARILMSQREHRKPQGTLSARGSSSLVQRLLSLGRLPVQKLTEKLRFPKTCLTLCKGRGQARSTTCSCVWLATVTSQGEKSHCAWLKAVTSNVYNARGMPRTNSFSNRSLKHIFKM